jgi:hypothetical protein
MNPWRKSFGIWVPDRKLTDTRGMVGIGIPQIGAVAGSRRRTSGGDADATAFFTATGITDSTIQSAIESLCSDLKSASVWDKMALIYPFVGGSSSAHSYNLKNTANNQITWSGTITHDANGVTGDNSTGAGDSGYSTSSMTANSLAFGIYSRTNSASNMVEIGTISGNTVHIYSKYTDNKAYFRNAATTGGLSGTVTASTRLILSSRTASDVHKGYRDGSEVATGSGAQGTIGTGTLRVLRGAAIWSNRNIAFAFLSAGLDATEVSALTSAVNTFQTTLGRNV